MATEPVDFFETWSVLKKTVKGIFTLGYVTPTAFEKGCSHVKSLCKANPTSALQLYDETKMLLEAHVNSLLIQVKEKRGEEILTVYYTLWKQYRRGVDKLDNLYLYLNTNFLWTPKVTEPDFLAIFEQEDYEEEGRKEICELGLDLWEKYMIEPLKADLLQLLFGGIHCDRTGQSLKNEKSSVIKDVIQTFFSVREKGYKKMGLYEKVFERPFLEATGEFYGREASRLLQECTISMYMEKVLQRRDEEDRRRSQKFLQPSLYNKVRSEFEKRMIADHLAVIHNACPTMLQQQKYKDLRNAYELLKLIPGSLTNLVSHFTEHINQEGLRTVTNLSGENIYHKFVEGMHSFHSEYKEITNTVFSNDQLFSSALDEACAEVLKHHLINTGQHSKSHPTLLAKYCDFLLKKSTKGVSDTEVDDKLTQCITVFKYIDDKDVFEKFYSLLFAIRLIQQQSQSMDAEEAMVGRLKLACVYEFTNKLHRMLTDMSVSSDLNNKFNQMNDVSVLGLNFSIYVLQSGAWPRQVCPTDFAVPQELEKSIQEFEDFYRLQFNGRKLTWLHNLSYGELKLNYLKKRYFITMGTFQMAILLVFQKTNSLTCGELMEATKLNSIQFQNTVKSLVKSKLLAVSGNTVEVFQPCTVISLNMDYSNQRTKFRINNSVKKETFQETETTHSSVNEDRKLHLQATIVRIMKSRMTLKHNVLIQEVLSLTKDRFVPVKSFIKKNIESLIEKEYLERAANSTDEYNYVA